MTLQLCSTIYRSFWEGVHLPFVGDWSWSVSTWISFRGLGITDSENHLLFIILYWSLVCVFWCIENGH